MKTMKIKMSILALFVLLISSCSVSDDSAIEITSNDLVGTWTARSATIDDVVLNVTAPITTTLVGSGFGKNFNSSLTFSENPNQVAVAGQSDFELTYTDLLGTETTETLTFDNIFFNNNFGLTNGTWTLNNNTLTLNEGGEIIEIRILSFSNGLLTFETNVNQAITLNGVTSTVVGVANIQIRKD
ncbi:MAG: hypothetical protein WAO74_09120 [Polaribacter sp.]|uniref:hypothetical protein n=1 Tax=Polaribacter sp. TaxID=1920175 RepID=UPI003BB0D0DD